jgi:hypothetical protein
VATHAQAPAPAQAPADTSPRLKPSEALREAIPQAERSSTTFVEGDRMRGGPTSRGLSKQCGVAPRRTIIRARRLEYGQATDKARAEGAHINKASNIFEGPLLEIELMPSTVSSTSHAIASCATTPTARPTDRLRG